MYKLPDPVDYAIPGFVLLVLVEMIVARLRDPRRYCPRDTLTSLALGFGSTIASLLVGGLLYLIASRIHALSPVHAPFAWWAWILMRSRPRRHESLVFMNAYTRPGERQSQNPTPHSTT